MVTATPVSRPARLDGLQWGRALAALLVVACHAIVHPLPYLPSFAVYIGDVGVTVFFIISGFIMVTTTGPSTFDPWLFMRRRIVRVVPLYYLATLVVVLFALFLPSLMKSTQFGLQHLVLSVLFIPTFDPNGGILPIYKLGWTLNFEMFFYVIFASLSFLTLTGRVVAVVVTFAFLAVLGVLITFDSAVLEFYTRMDVLAFAAGVVIAYVKNWRRWSIPPMVGISGFAVAVLAIVGVFIFFGTMREIALAHFLTIAACALLVTVLATIENAGNSKVFRFFVLLGDASYALYLFHIFVVAGVWWAAGRLFGPLDPLSHIGIIFVATVGSVAAGVVIHLVLERPITRILTKLVAPRKAPSPATT